MERGRGAALQSHTQPDAAAKDDRGRETKALDLQQRIAVPMSASLLESRVSRFKNASRRAAPTAGKGIRGAALHKDELDVAAVLRRLDRTTAWDEMTIPEKLYKMTLRMAPCARPLMLARCLSVPLITFRPTLDLFGVTRCTVRCPFPESYSQCNVSCPYPSTQRHDACFVHSASNVDRNA